MISKIPAISRQMIRAWTGAAALERGESYYRGGAVEQPRRQGQSIKCYCQGSLPQPYRVRVTFNNEGISAAECSCPTGSNGRCKHTAALLFAWNEVPGHFVYQPMLDEHLESMSRPELIALIKRLVMHDPVMEELIDFSTSQNKNNKSIDPRLISREVKRAIQDSLHGSQSTIFQMIKPVFDLADTLLTTQEYVNAVIVYQETIKVIRENDEDFASIEGALLEILDSCLLGLGNILEQSQDNDLRKAIFFNLWELIQWNFKAGDLDIGDRCFEVILRHAASVENRYVSDWLRTTLSDMDQAYVKEKMGGFLLKLEEENLDDQSYLQICRETGRIHDLVDRLLILGRKEEALDTASLASDHKILHLADLFILHGMDDQADQLVYNRSQYSDNLRFLVWRRDHAQRKGKLLDAVALAEQIFWKNPTIKIYEELRALAEQANNWNGVYSQTILELINNGEDELLTEIFINEHDIERALIHLEKFKQKASKPYWWEGSRLDIRLAEAAASSHTHVAIHLYLDKVSRLIKLRGRSNYATAVRLLLKVKQIYSSENDLLSWSKLISQLRSENQRLPALQDELDQAEL